MYTCRKLWFQQWYETAAAYNTLKKRPNIPKSIDRFIRRTDVVKEIKPLITPNAERQGNRLIVGEKDGKIPVLIIDNANKMGKNDLEDIQDYAKHACDHGIAAVVLVTTEGHVPRHMMRKLNLFTVLFLTN